ncbi:GNAT family N-acetyltransferase [Streptomyces sp. NPDC001833]|uniref:GNAT family N-acetyltransferase n=1 Tax=Streptomyces sp. NPDC001833 TaxID=3154658 RepID=UPI003321A659
MAVVDQVPTPPEPRLGGGWTLRLLTDSPAVSYAVTGADGGPPILLRLRRVLRDPVRACYPFGAHDLVVGVVPSEGDPDAGRSMTARLLRVLVPALFAADPHCRRLVAAPDEDDTVTREVLEEGGFRQVAEADLPGGSVVLFAAERPEVAGLSTALDDMPH